MMDFDEYEYLEKTVENPELQKDKETSNGGNGTVKSEERDHSRTSKRKASEKDNDVGRFSKHSKSGDDSRDYDHHKERGSSRHRSLSRDGDKERDQLRSIRDNRDRMKDRDRDKEERYGRETDREQGHDRDRERDRRDRANESARECERDRSRRSRSRSERHRSDLDERDRERSHDRDYRDRERNQDKDYRDRERERASRESDRDSSIAGSLGNPVANNTGLNLPAAAHLGAAPVGSPQVSPLASVPAVAGLADGGLQILTATPTIPSIDTIGGPSECLLLKNMFDPKDEKEPDFDLDIKEDVEAECSKFGKLRHIYVDKNSAGFVYLRFENIQSAINTQRSLHGRWFAGKMITASFMVPQSYEDKFPDNR